MTAKNEIPKEFISEMLTFGLTFKQIENLWRLSNVDEIQKALEESEDNKYVSI